MKDNKQAQSTHKQGVPWKTTFRASSYEEADRRRNELLHGWHAEGIKNMQVKVKWMASTDSFIVKTRQDPSKVKEQKKKTSRNKKGKKAEKKPASQKK